MVVSIYVVKHRILDLVADGDKTIYDINNNLNIITFRNIGTLRKHIAELVNAGSVVTYFDENKNATMFKVAYL